MKGSAVPKIILVNIDKIKPYKNNPRQNDSDVEKVAESITLFGFKNPILLDTKNVIVCGHTRWKAAKKLGMKQVREHSRSQLDNRSPPESREVERRRHDYDFSEIKRLVHDRIDHKCLNSVIPINPTAENIARWIVESVPHCYKAVVVESENNEGIYEV